MIDLGLSAAAVVAAAEYLGQKAADGAAFSAGAKVIDWIKEKLTGQADKAALEKLEENPHSESAREKMQEILAARLKQDANLAQNFEMLLKRLQSLQKESGINQSGSGDHFMQTVAKGTGINQTISANISSDRK